MHHRGKGVWAASSCFWVGVGFKGILSCFITTILVGMLIFNHPEIPHCHCTAWSVLCQKPPPWWSCPQLPAAKCDISSGITFSLSKGMIVTDNLNNHRGQGLRVTGIWKLLRLESPFVKVCLEPQPEEQVCTKPLMAVQRAPCVPVCHRVSPCVPQPCAH